jgi:hypothetical protein
MSNIRKRKRKKSSKNSGLYSNKAAESTFQGQTIQATSSGGGNLTVMVLL